jgi:hypothetical protein
MSFFVKDSSLNRAQIFRPLLLDMDKRPLAAAKDEMLNAGQHQKIVLVIRHFYIILTQDTPAGIADASMCTV